ncbi:hypothetical protein IEO21_01733 [Rhodonia placenta]|uniref:Uncharacterized protein n=1 Tax=Rhodonia placenta TaxID=104341 RepID=A0A8H7U5M3_9APHY|nr:hypothetical protein IEO21_01733 [Postia placenta]
MDRFVPGLGYESQDDAGWIFPTQTGVTIPLYRMHSQTDHFYHSPRYLCVARHRWVCLLYPDLRQYPAVPPLQASGPFLHHILGRGSEHVIHRGLCGGGDPMLRVTRYHGYIE